MKKLCTKSGNGDCVYCKEEYKNEVLCKNTIAYEHNNLHCMILDMVDYIYDYDVSGRFNNKRQIYDYFWEEYK